MNMNSQAAVDKLVERLRRGDLCDEIHPATTGDHETADIAREIVGHHYFKSDLVQVVNVLLAALRSRTTHD